MSYRLTVHCEESAKGGLSFKGPLPLTWRMEVTGNHARYYVIAQVTPLSLRESMGGGDRLVSNGQHARFLLK
ncbi:hypothetical protein EVAR_35717_1 [Eumeta japonica]|uniref:Uncharacterized protein n=1 Tax=Eumeta variegata TaxID=151549 RepID=A0A4C1VF79_EUMVA|nr:hypothetical protein EVAR_35717_1 [Eumeta japonica]